RPGGRNPGWREGDEQADRAWYACSPASELSGINGLGNGHPATDLINNASFGCGLFCLATNQIAQTGLSSLPPVIYYSEQLFSSI
ncbi:hypothetical protein, partial [Aeromonas sp. PrichA-15]|uniref:hypothetical protein n=1 Tax=Aeromonas sp. PrichA-15 TaxID=2823360 RepID=UPI001B343ECC